MGSAQITQIPVTTQATLCWSGIGKPSEQVVLWNQDINNTVYIGFSSTITANGGNTLPISPNGTWSLGADRSIYVVGATQGISPLVVIPDSNGMFLGVTQGLGSLAIPSIHSPNYQAGISGWSINKVGSAEFNNLTIRGNFIGPDFFLSNGDGTLTTTPGYFMYSGPPAAGNLIYSITTASTGHDKFNNNYLGRETGYNNLLNFATNYNAEQINYYTFSAQPNAVFTQLNATIKLEQRTIPVLGATSGLEIFDYILVNNNCVIFGDPTNNILKVWTENADGNVYNAGKDTNNVGLTHITSTSPQLIARINVLTGVTYHYKVTCIYTGLQAAGQPVMTFGGTATFSHVKGHTQFGFDASQGVGIFPDQTTLPSRTGPTLSVGNFIYRAEFWITCNGSGTIDFSGNDSIVNDNWDALQTFTELEIIS
jgi:hypothetical protein